MVFSSVIFLWIFLPVVFLGNLLVGRKVSNIFLLLASLIFYAWGEPVRVIIMIFSVIWNWVMGIAIDKSKHKKAALIAGVLVDLGFLGWFKYAGFFADIINGIYGGSLIPRPEIELPIGISFFTFQAISYIADVYRGKARASADPMPVALYISFFPQLIAGPIVQYTSVEKQLKERCVSVQGMTAGFKRFLYGLGKKVLIANIMAECADAAFALDSPGIAAAWIGALAYTLQIYYDFSGYSDMALGLGKMFGFSFPENFNYPYISKSISEFWRRWHISLGAWFREYVYIPLGGNRKGKGRTYTNLFTVFFLTGLWHGADLSFILWGLYHGLISLAERAGLKKLQDNSRVLSRLICFVLVLIGWVLFRADNTSAALKYLGCMFGAGGDTPLWKLGNVKTLVIGVLAVIGAGPLQSLCPESIKQKWKDSAAEAVFVMLLLFFSLSALAGNGYNPFIYFQF